FVNTGTFVKQNAAAAGTTTINGNVTFTNAGTVDVQTGALQIASGPAFTNFAANTLTGGTYVVRAGAAFDTQGRTVTTLAANTTVELTGAGSSYADINSLTTVNGT